MNVNKRDFFWYFLVGALSELSYFSLIYFVSVSGDVQVCAVFVLLNNSLSFVWAC